MAENWYNNTHYHPAVQNRNHFMPIIDQNYHEPSYGPILSHNRASNMLEHMGIYNGERTSMEEARFINNEKGYRGNYYSNQYHPSLHNHENFLYASYSNEEKPSLEYLVGEFVNESKMIEAAFDKKNPSIEDLFGEFATSFSKRMEYNEQKLDDLELHLVNLGATMKNLVDQVCQLATAVNARIQEKFVDEDIEVIESTPTYEELFPSKHEEGRNGKEEMYDFHDDISNLSYPQLHTQLVFEYQTNQALETFKKLPTNNCFVEVEFVAHEEDLKRKRIDELDNWSFNVQEPPGKENWASVARRQHEDLFTMGWSIDNIIGETPMVTLDKGEQ